MKQTKQGAAERRGEEAEPQVAALVNGQPSDHRAEGHYSLDAEV
jgi:hypothetical protein